MQTRRLDEDVAKEAQSPLQQWMLDRGIRQSWLAEQTGLRQPLISKFATKKTVPDVFEAQKIVNAFRTITPEVSIEMLWPLED